MVTVLTTCPFCSCGCGLHLQAVQGRPDGCAPSEGHPLGQGKLCARGWHAHEAPLWGRRATHPLVRRDGELTEVSWAEALTVAASGLSELRREGRPVGVLGSAQATNEESFLAFKLARGALVTGNLDCVLRSGIQPYLDGIASVTGNAWPPGDLLDLESSEVVVVFEGDLAATHPRAASLVATAVKRGARLVTVGWHRSQMSRLAARHLAVDPRAGHAVVPEILAAVLEAGAGDGPIEGFETLQASLVGRAVREEAREVAGWYRAATRASIVLAEGAFLPDEARAGAAALAMLAAVTGHLGRSGSALLLLPARGNLRGALEAGVRPDALAGGAPLGDAVAADRMRQAWAREPWVGPGLDAEAMVGACAGLVVMAEELPAVLTAGGRGLAAGADRKLLVVLDSFLTETALAADVVLPVASFGENEGTTTSADGRVQRVTACAPPPGLARAGWQVLGELVASLGAPAAYPEIGDLRREMARLAPALGEDGATPPAARTGSGVRLRAIDLPRREPGEEPLVAVFDEAFDWGSDPMVARSPTLSRNHAARRKLLPAGFVELAKADADRLGVRAGWAVRVVSSHGEATVPVVVSGELAPGVARLPFSARDRVGAVLGGRGRAGVRVERV